MGPFFMSLDKEGVSPMVVNSEYIYAIVNHGSFSKAAEALFIAQPALSRYVIKLENALGIKIFERGKSPVTLTAAGRELVDYLNKSQKLEKDFRSRLDAIREAEGRQVKLGIVPWRIPLFLPGLIPDFTKKFPHIEVRVSEDVSNHLEEATVSGALDVCVINGPSNNPALEYTRLSEEQIELLAPASSRFAQRHAGRRIDLGGGIDWEDEPFILLRKDFRLGKIARSIFQYYGGFPKNVIEVWNMNSAISMVCAGMGLAFIPASGKPRHLPPDKQPISFQIAESCFSFPLLLAYRKENYEKDAVKILIDFIVTYYPKLSSTVFS